MSLNRLVILWHGYSWRFNPITYTQWWWCVAIRLRALTFSGVWYHSPCFMQMLGWATNAEAYWEFVSRCRSNDNWPARVDLVQHLETAANKGGQGAFWLPGSLGHGPKSQLTVRETIQNSACHVSTEMLWTEFRARGFLVSWFTIPWVEISGLPQKAGNNCWSWIMYHDWMELPFVRACLLEKRWQPRDVQTSWKPGSSRCDHCRVALIDGYRGFGSRLFHRCNHSQFARSYQFLSVTFPSINLLPCTWKQQRHRLTWSYSRACFACSFHLNAFCEAFLCSERRLIVILLSIRAVFRRHVSIVIFYSRLSTTSIFIPIQSTY